MGMKEEIKILDLTETQAAIEAIGDRARNMRPVMVSVREQMRYSTDQNFNVGGRPRWTPSEKTRKGRGKTLIGKSRLWHSVKYEVGDDRLTISSNLPYSAVHQKGFKGKVKQHVRPHHRTITQAFGRSISPKRIQVKRGFYRQFMQNIPARPYIVVQREDTEYTQKRLLRWVTEGI